MKTCPYCAEQIQDDAVKCRYCGEFLDSDSRAARHEVEPTLEERAKLAEIRRLQRIASGQPTRADAARKTKGLLCVVIIAAILVYAYNWRRLHVARPDAPPTHSAISFRAFDALFGANSPLSAEAKREEFGNYRDKWVIWTGTVAYVNRAKGESYLSIRQRATTRTTDVVLQFKEKDRDRLRTVHPEERVRYTGKIADYSRENGYITLTNGLILSSWQ